MTYDASKIELGREPVTIVEIDLDYCSLTYGIAPCTASVGVTGAQKCFNTRRTCQDSANFDKTTKTYRFSNLLLPIGAPTAIPSLVKVSTLPTVINPGRGIGQRAKVTITFQDAPLADRNIDKYVDERTYDSGTQGTFWGKLLARNPFYNGRVVRVKTGYITGGVYDAANFVTKLYVIEQIAGPDARGMVTLTAKDVLKLVDDKRAQTPVASLGKLLIALTTGTSSFSVAAGLGAGYPASGYIIIGQEIMSFTRSTDTFTVGRAQFNTAAQTHAIGDTVQICTQYDNVLVHDILYDLLTVKGTVPTSYITKADWDAEVADWLSSQYLSALICKPVGITTLIDEICEQALVYIWWDEIQQKILLRAIRPSRDDEITVLNEDDHIVKDSFSVTDTPGDRLSEVWVYFGQRDPSQELDKASNYEKNYVTVDTDAEDETEYNEQRIRVIYSRWLPADNPSNAALLGARLLARFRDNPKRVRLSLDAKDSDLWTGDVATVQCRQHQDETGAADVFQLQVLSAQESIGGTKYDYELVDSFFQGRYGFITPDDEPDYDDASESQRSRYGFISPDSGVFADGTPAYKIV